MMPTPNTLARVRQEFAYLTVKASNLRWRSMLKAGFDPNQPRVPAGNPVGGQWARVGGGTGRGTASRTRETIRSDDTGTEPWHAVITRRREDGSIAQETVLNRDGSVIRSDFPESSEEASFDERYTDPSLQEELFQAIEKRALPALRNIETLDQFVAFASLRERFSISYFDGYLLIKVGVDIARGELDAARAACAELATGKTRWSMPLMHDEFVRVTETLCPLLAANDRTAMARLLHEWEAYTVEKLKLDGVWERTPFPLEETRPNRR